MSACTAVDVMACPASWRATTVFSRPTRMLRFFSDARNRAQDRCVKVFQAHLA